MLSQEEIQKLVIVGILFLVVCLFARFVYMLVIETFGFPMVNKQPSILAGMMAPSGRQKCNSMGNNLVVKFRLELCNYQMLYKLQITANSSLFYKQCFCLQSAIDIYANVRALIEVGPIYNRISAIKF